MEFIEKLECAAAAQEKVILTDDPMKRRVFERLPSGNIGSRTRATLKIEDGCSNFCSYCIIPYARGPVRSLPIDALERQARRLKEDGYREIIITGIEIASYGRDLKNGLNLADAVCTAAEEAPRVRIRLGSLEARVVTEEFAERIALRAPYAHISTFRFRAAAIKTLKNMNRRYDSARFYEACRTLRRYFPGCALTADLIVGFPGETEDDFRESMEFIKKCGFYQVHVFPYSRRPAQPRPKWTDRYRILKSTGVPKQPERYRSGWKKNTLKAVWAKFCRYCLKRRRMEFQGDTVKTMCRFTPTEPGPSQQGVLCTRNENIQRRTFWRYY